MPPLSITRRPVAADSYESATLAIDPHHWGSPGSLRLSSLGKGRTFRRAGACPRRPRGFTSAPTKFHRTKTFPLGGRWPGEAGSDEERRNLPKRMHPTKTHPRTKSTPHLALPLGELAAKPTERAVAIRKGPLRPVCALGTSPIGRGKGGVPPLSIRDCYPGNRPPPQGVTRFVTGWWTNTYGIRVRRALAAPADHVGLPLHPPSSTAPKPSPSGEGGSPQARRRRGAV